MRGRVLVVSLLMFALPVGLFGQNVREVAVGCDRGHHWRSPCDGNADCTRVLAAHNCSAHGEGCGSSESSGSGVSMPSLAGSPAHVIVAGAVLGGFGGALIGSLGTSADSNSMAGAGAAIGFGTAMAMGVLRNKSEWGRASSTVVGAIGGAAIGAGTGAMADGKYKKGSADDLAHKDQVAPQATAGAVAGAVLGFTLNTLATSQFNRNPRLRRITQRIRVIDSGRRVGLTVLW